MGDEYVYLVIMDSKGADLKGMAFYNPESAIREARMVAKHYCEYKVDYDEPKDCLDDNLIFTAIYSFEGDRVSVMKSKIYDD